MRILLSTDWNDKAINGVVRSVLNLKLGLEALGHEVRILTLSDTMFSHMEGDTYYVGSLWVGYVYPRARARFEMPIFPSQVYDILDWEPEVVHSNCEISTFHIAYHIAKMANVPLVHTYHTIYEHYFKYFPLFAPFPHLSRLFIRDRTRMIARKCDCMIVPTKKIEDLLHSYGVTERISIIPSGIDLDDFKRRASKADPHAIRRSLGIDDDCKVLAQVGRIAKEKNITELFELVSGLDDEKIILLVVGDGPYKEKLMEVALNMGISDRVIFTGMIDQKILPGYYMAADLFVCASTSETQGLCYAEALCCGVPMLCRWDPCLDGLILEGENGWTYSSEDEFVQRLNEFFAMSEEDKKKLSDKAIESVDKLSVPAFAAAVLKIYESVIEEHQGDSDSISA